MLPTIPPELLEIFSKIGVIGLLGYMWLRAESRADRERDKNEVLSKEMIGTMIKTEETLKTLGEVFSSVRKSGR